MFGCVDVPNYGNRLVPCQLILMNHLVSIGERLREERVRLGMSQTSFGEAGGVTKKSQMLYEGGERAPDAAYLHAVSSAGVDVGYVITGKRDPSLPALDSAELSLLDSYRRCKPEARVNLIQTAALLSAGLPPAAPSTTSGGGMLMSNLGDGNVQVGSGSRVSVKRSK